MHMQGRADINKCKPLVLHSDPFLTGHKHSHYISQGMTPEQGI